MNPTGKMIGALAIAAGVFLIGGEGIAGAGRELTCPPNYNLNVRCDVPVADLDWDPLCTGTPGCTCTVLSGALPECPPQWLVDNGGEFPAGEYLFECTTDCEGQPDYCAWTVNVIDEALLDVIVELSPTMSDIEFTRCIER